MEGLTRTASSTSPSPSLPLPFPHTPSPSPRFLLPLPLPRRRHSSFPRLSSSSSSSDDPSHSDLDHWDRMEMEFGRFIGEEPDLTLTKVMARKADPGASYLEIEKAYRKKKLATKKHKPLPVDKPLDRGVKRSESPPGLRAPTRPANLESIVDDRVGAAAAAAAAAEEEQEDEEEKEGEGEAVDVAALRRPAHPFGSRSEAKARKPSIVNFMVKKKEDGGGERLSDATLLRKPELVRVSEEKGGESVKKDEREEMPSNVSLQRKPELVGDSKEKGEGNGRRMRKDEEEEAESLSGMNLLRKPGVVKGSGNGPGRDSPGSVEEDSGALLGRKWIEILSKPTRGVGDKDGIMDSEADISLDDDGSYEDDGIEDRTSKFENWDLKFTQTLAKLSSPVTPLGELPRSDSPSMKESEFERTEVSNDELAKDAAYKLLISSEQEEHEESDWERAEQVLQAGEVQEVEVVSCSTRGFFVSFGSLVGFLPYRNLIVKYKFLVFETWLRKKGLEPASYRENLRVIVRGYDAQDEDPSLKENETLEFDRSKDVKPGMKFEELLQIYNYEKLKFLSHYVGQRIRACVVLVDRDSRKLVFSGKPIEKKGELETKRQLMAKLNVGDIVQCCVKKLVFYGVFVEVEGVTALIHQSEISWDLALDPKLFFKKGQIIQAKVHQLDYDLDHITLSLKEMTPDPLSEALESAIGKGSPLDAGIESSSRDEEWADVESLVQELEKVDGITCVTRGRFFLSPGLVPTFQVYMASTYDDRYKLLARYRNKVQEVMVQSSLDKEQMREAILTCTNRIA